MTELSGLRRLRREIATMRTNREGRVSILRSDVLAMLDAIMDQAEALESARDRLTRYERPRFAERRRGAA